MHIANNECRKELPPLESRVRELMRHLDGVKESDDTDTDAKIP